jgi:hypothetical protein
MIRHHVQQVAAGNPFDWRILANGYLDEMGYERGQINTSLPFAELRRRSDITARARAAGDRGDFSNFIREGLPERPVASRAADRLDHVPRRSAGHSIAVRMPANSTNAAASLNRLSPSTTMDSWTS